MWSFLPACIHFVTRALLLCGALTIDLSFFYMNILFLVPLTICVYLCALTYASVLFLFFTLCFGIIMPLALSLSWVFFVFPLVLVTVVGLLARALLLVLWPLPYFLAFLYAIAQYMIGMLNPTALVLMPRLTIGSFFVILIVIKITSLIVSTHPRRGNRV